MIQDSHELVLISERNLTLVTSANTGMLVIVLDLRI
jgi:hypothetical protein